MTKTTGRAFKPALQCEPFASLVNLTPAPPLFAFLLSGERLQLLRDEAIPYEIEQVLIKSRGRSLSDDYLFSASGYLVILGREAWLRARHDISVIPEEFDWACHIPLASAIISHFSDQGLDVDCFDGS
jgi:hypothetical protein